MLLFSLLLIIVIPLLLASSTTIKRKVNVKMRAVYGIISVIVGLVFVKMGASGIIPKH